MATLAETINNLLIFAVKSKASDIHIKSSCVARIRINNRLQQVEMTPLRPEQITAFVQETMPDAFKDQWVQHFQVDYSYHLPEPKMGRFRVNAFYQRGVPSIVFRHIKDQPPKFSDLEHDDAVLRKLAESHDGIVLVCGPTGSGKSSTLAAMLSHINDNHDNHIVTLEDPIEFNYEDNRSVFSQREMGIDAISFEEGLKAALRQDPDIILIGEMRDRSTFETALHAAQTGHLVLSTLHSANTQQAIQRIFEFFPLDQQEVMRRQIATTLRGVIAQLLISSADGVKRVPVIEALVVESLAKKVIMDGTFQKIPNVLEASKGNGSKTFNMDFLRLINEGKVTKEAALEAAHDPEALEMNLKGIFLSSGGIVG